MSNSNSERFSPLLLARILGILGLVGILTGAFDIGYVQSTLIVAGNPSATLHNMLAHETLFRLGFASHLFELVLNIPGEIIAFYLFRRVNVIVAAIGLCCGVVGIAIEAVDLLSTYVPLKLAIEGSALGAFSPEQLHALSYISAQLQQAGLLLSWVFYGIDELATGFLLFRSGFLPRVLGVLGRKSPDSVTLGELIEIGDADARSRQCTYSIVSLRGSFQRLRTQLNQNCAKTLSNCGVGAYFEREADSPKLLKILETQSKGWKAWNGGSCLQSRCSPS